MLWPATYPLLCARPPARGFALLRPSAACYQPHSLRGQLTTFLRLFWQPEGVEETAPLKLRSRWSRRASSGGGPRSGVEAGRLDLGSASLESLARELRAHPPTWARSQSPPYLRRPGGAQRGARGQAAAARARVKRASLCAGPGAPRDLPHLPQRRRLR